MFVLQQTKPAQRSSLASVQGGLAQVTRLYIRDKSIPGTHWCLVFSCPDLPLTIFLYLYYKNIEVGLGTRTGV